MTQAQTAILEHAQRAYAPRSVLVRKTLPQHATECAKCGARVDPAKLYSYQLCDRCLGINHDEPRVKYGEDSGAENQAAAFAPRLDAVLADTEVNTVAAGSIGKVKVAPGEYEPFEACTVAGADGIGVFTKSQGAKAWPQPPHKMLDDKHRLTNVDEEHRLAYCSAHGHNVTIAVALVRGTKTYYRCGAANTYRDQARQVERRLASVGGSTNTAVTN